MKAAKAPSVRHPEPSPQFHYEQLMQFNQHCTAALDLIEFFARQRIIPRNESRYYRSMLQELRASASQIIIEYIDQRELSAAAQASKERLKLEKQLFK